MGLQEVQAHVFQSSSFVVFELRPGSGFYDNHRSANALLFQASNFKTVGLLSCDTFRNDPSGLCQAHIQVLGAEAFSQDCDFSKRGRLNAVPKISFLLQFPPRFCNSPLQIHMRSPGGVTFDFPIQGSPQSR